VNIQSDIHRAIVFHALRHVSPSAGRKPGEVSDGKALPCLVTP
jgi:hypothetical protein